MIPDGALILIFFGLVLALVSLVVACISLYSMIEGMRKGVNKSFSTLKQDIMLLNDRTRGLKHNDPKYVSHYIMPEPTGGKDYTQ